MPRPHKSKAGLPRRVRAILTACDYYSYIYFLSFVLRPIDTKFLEEVYDIDAETESDNEAQAAKVDIGTKDGYLLKGPEIGSERIFSNLASKSFKKRYCSMVREADGGYIMEVYKDDKKTDTKLTIVMDFCSDVVKVSKSLITQIYVNDVTRLDMCSGHIKNNNTVLLYHSNKDVLL